MHQEPKIVASITPEEIHQWRRSMKMSVIQFACFIGAADGRNIRRWERGDRAIPAYVDILYDLYRMSDANRARLIEIGMKEWHNRLASGLIASPADDEDEPDAPSPPTQTPNPMRQ